MLINSILYEYGIDVHLLGLAGTIHPTHCLGEVGRYKCPIQEEYIDSDEVESPCPQAEFVKKQK